MKRILFIISCSIALGVRTVAALPDAQITVGPNVQVSRARADAVHFEVLIASDPTDAKKLLGCSIIGPTPDGKMVTGAYASFDEGITWSPVVTDGGQMQSVDPACAYGDNGTAHFASLSRGKDFITRLNAYHSEDGGRTWTESKIPEGSRYHIDREYLAVDNTQGRYRGRLYLY